MNAPLSSPYDCAADKRSITVMVLINMPVRPTTKPTASMLGTTANISALTIFPAGLDPVVDVSSVGAVYGGVEMVAVAAQWCGGGDGSGVVVVVVVIGHTAEEVAMRVVKERKECEQLIENNQNLSFVATGSWRKVHTQRGTNIGTAGTRKCTISKAQQS